MRLSLQPDDFIWATGIEDTFVPEARGKQRPLDEYELMGHYDHWREDLALTRELGVAALRWGVPWYRVEPQPGCFDWSWTDQVLPYLVEQLGVTPIIDLVHYGCPPWLARAFDSERYPDAVAAYAGAFARRYRDLVHWYTPLNEPHMTCLMCGWRGVWPPYLRGERGYIRIMIQSVLGIIRTVEAILEVDPGATIVQVEAAALHRAGHADLAALAEEEHMRRFLSYDLLTGRVTLDHPLFPWLIRNGTPPATLRAIAERPVRLDVMGLNFYPQWSTHQLYVRRSGRVGIRSCEQDGAGLAELIEGYYERYGLPVMVTETSAYGSDEVRSRWLGASVDAVKELRERGVPVVGYTWFPLFTMIDWRYRFGLAPADSYRIELGLYVLNTEGVRWRPSELVDHYSQIIGRTVPPVQAAPAISLRPLRVESA